ncbi:MAG: phage holin family protein [Patescibacteria group bacterium]
MKLLLKWLINALALLGIAYLIRGISVSSFYVALVAALVLGLINALVKPLLILLTLPVNILTVGLFTFVINALLFWFVSTVVKGFSVADFAAAFWGALCLSVVSWLTHILLKK